MNKMYVIYKYNDNDYYANEENMFATTSQKRASELVNKLERIQNHHNSFIDNEYSKFKAHYHIDYPPPVAPIRPCLTEGLNLKTDAGKKAQKQHIEKLDLYKENYTNYANATNKYTSSLMAAFYIMAEKNYNMPKDLLEVLDLVPNDEFSYTNSLTTNYKFGYCKIALVE